jgi:hypothetical protein
MPRPPTAAAESGVLDVVPLGVATGNVARETSVSSTSGEPSIHASSSFGYAMRDSTALLARVGDRPRPHLYVAPRRRVSWGLARRFAYWKRLPGRPAEKDPSVGVPEPDLDAAGGARFASVRGDVDRAMLLDGRAES